MHSLAAAVARNHLECLPGRLNHLWLSGGCSMHAVDLSSSPSFVASYQEQDASSSAIRERHDLHFPGQTVPQTVLRLGAHEV